MKLPRFLSYFLKISEYEHFSCDFLKIKYNNDV